MEWLDVSLPVREGMVVYEGDPEVRVERVSSMAAGDPADVSRLELGSHTGTHVDAPAHFVPGGGGVETLPVDALIGPATVVDAGSLGGDIDREAVPALVPDGAAARILFRTHYGAPWERGAFSPDHAAGVTPDAARELVERGVRLVGIDRLSIAPAADAAPTHRILLEAGVVIVESLDLRRAPAGEYDLLCLPLLLEGLDGAPARALLRPRRAAAEARSL